MDPYRPPASDIADPAQGLGSPVNAVVLGLLVDLGGTLFFSLIVGFGYSAYLAAQGVPLEQVQDQAQAMFQEGWGFAIAVAVGCGFSALGGYVCARISRREDFSLAYVLAALSILLSLPLAWQSYSWVELILLDALTVGCIFAGTQLGMRRGATAAN